MDALEDHDLVVVEPEGPELLRVLSLALEVKVGDHDLPALVQGLQVAAQKGGVQALGGLQVVLPVGHPGEVRLGLGAVVVVQGDHVGVDAPVQQGLPDPGGRGGLAGGGRSRQQDDPAVLQPAHHKVGGLADPVVVEVVAALDEALGVRAQGVVDVVEFEPHGR